MWLMQIDTPGKALLLGISLFYVGVVLVVPTANVFYQVGSSLLFSDLGMAVVVDNPAPAHWQDLCACLSLKVHQTRHAPLILYGALRSICARHSVCMDDSPLGLWLLHLACHNKDDQQLPNLDLLIHQADLGLQDHSSSSCKMVSCCKSNSSFCRLLCF